MSKPHDCPKCGHATALSTNLKLGEIVRCLRAGCDWYEEHQCGGTQEACGFIGCRECGMYIMEAQSDES